MRATCRLWGPAHACGMARHFGVRRSRAAFEGVTPDLDLHCARINQSARAMCLKPAVSKDDWIALVRRRPQALPARRRALYPADVLGRGGRSGRRAGRSRNRPAECLTIYDAPMPQPTGTAITLSPFRRPTRESAPLDAKAGCLYPNNARALIEARGARLRQLSALRHAGQYRRTRHRQYIHGEGRRRLYAGSERHLSRRHHPDACDQVIAPRPASRSPEATLRYSDFQTADEIFSTGNYTKVSPITRIDERSLQPGTGRSAGLACELLLGVRPRRGLNTRIAACLS